MNRYEAEAKEVVYHILGGICCRCKFADSRALQIDHKLGDGTIDRERKDWLRFKYRIILDHLLNTPPNEWRYQILCANCNWIKAIENNEHSRWSGARRIRKLKSLVKQAGYDPNNPRQRMADLGEVVNRAKVLSAETLPAKSEKIKPIKEIDLNKELKAITGRKRWIYGS